MGASGPVLDLPEIDRIEYLGPFEAKRKVNPVQAAFISRLIDYSSKN